MIGRLTGEKGCQGERKNCAGYGMDDFDGPAQSIGGQKFRQINVLLITKSNQRLITKELYRNTV